MIRIRNITHKLTKGSGLILAVTSAAVIGGATTAIVTAAIPSGNGTISACYDKNKGDLSVIDAEAGKTCSNKQNPLSWSTGSSGGGSSNPTVTDANGQVLGTLLVMGVGYPIPQDQVYNATLHRAIPISEDELGNVVVGATARAYFQSSDCTGQAYFNASTPESSDLNTLLYHWNSGTGEHQAIVADNANKQTITANSFAQFNESDEVRNYFCFSTNVTDNFYPLTPVTLPFTTPITTPLKFQ